MQSKNGFNKINIYNKNPKGESGHRETTRHRETLHISQMTRIRQRTKENQEQNCTDN